MNDLAQRLAGVMLCAIAIMALMFLFALIAAWIVKAMIVVGPYLEPLFPTFEGLKWRATS